METMKQNTCNNLKTVNNFAKFIGYSLVGIFMFFVPLKIWGQSSIPIDHIVTGLKKLLGPLTSIYALIIVVLGAAYPFLKKTWNKDVVTTIFSILKVCGIAIGSMAYFRIGPSWMFQPDMIPFLFDKLVIPLGLIIPIGGAFLAFLVGYGFLEFAGVFMRPIMKPIFKTQGRSAIDAVASFVGSYSLALLITNRVFKEGKYTIKEACIIATGFSTVSATFMIIVAKTLGIMNIWNTYFWTTFLVTFTVTAITVRIRPLSKKSDSYITEIGDPEPDINSNYFENALNEGLKVASASPSIGKCVWDNFKDSLVMTMGILPSILSVGLLGLVLAKFTPIFDVLGYIFYPFVKLLQIPEAMLTSKAAALGIAEMFLPALLVKDAPMVTKFIIGVTSISSILFFSASIPCIMSTEIPLKLSDVVIIWFERTLLTIIIVTPIAFLLF
ncbi:nucleoside recognition membrane protein YjiH [Clostridium tetanomorphum]|uniref:YjiH family protein n=1 Tax=Clostridium tetanomorphum TaxID=1553 RepID=A0A923IZZ9_CLOTT|nr:YjiH family protein [Clostridium tetanomorphum]KAJ53604.1 nucleoside recognition domain-containing protein [Clostridium tetanomorphum DSM 665]MBC2397811.1 YjiH family protein [Clostridium tetanomorphum]MBP1864586.1 nucleoside recognition membrane protein YjiH [Clostridium tetanomorphum]NRS84055.1 nucleoside recognition membrane protein YjiH [Clostridium tetanomorphum]NRZ97270.1 nucleoside recognition membrane protein YjiH [Clostridium tetanomorphum]